MLVPSGVVTGVGIFATVGIIAVVGVTLKAGILLGQTSRRHADKKTAATGEWVEPNVTAAVTDALGRMVARNTLNTGKKIAVLGVKKAGKKIGTKLGEKIPEGIALSHDVTKAVRDYAIKVSTVKPPVDQELLLEVVDLFRSVDEIIDRPYPTVIDADYLNKSTAHTLRVEAGILAELAAQEEELYSEPVRNIEEEIFLAGVPLHQNTEPVAAPTEKTPVAESDKKDDSEEGFDLAKAKEKIASVFTEENVDTVVDFAVKNRDKVLGFLNKKLDKVTK